MAKVTLQTITSGYGSAALINANFAAIAAALELLLSRDGTTPNSMAADLDMDGNQIYNLPDPGSSGAPMTLGYYQTLEAVPIGTTTASAVSVTDTNDYYTADNVEGILDEIGASLGGAAPEDVTVVRKVDYNANSILHAVTDDTPVALTIGTSTVYGRPASGNAQALTRAQLAPILSPVSVITTDTAATACTTYAVDTATTGAVTLTLPDTTTFVGGEYVNVYDVASNFATANLTVKTNGTSTDNINDVACHAAGTGILFDVDDISVKFIWSNSTHDWNMVSF